jgi:hypothetical protein
MNGVKTASIDAMPNGVGAQAQRQQLATGYDSMLLRR